MLNKEKTVGEYVSENIKTAHIFKKYGIDFCCGGGISLAKACEKNGLDPAQLEQELTSVEANTDRTLNYNSWELSFLIDHIINVHHTYVKESIPMILEYTDKVARVHGHNYPEVVQVNNIFREVAEALYAHLNKEEMILFPFVKELEMAIKEQRDPVIPPFGSVDNPIAMMEDDHENAGDAFKAIAKLTNNFTPPEGACNTFRALYSKLEEFEQDLHQHVHLENNILHIKAQRLESNILSH